jgi:hypothetical protein
MTEIERQKASVEQQLRQSEHAFAASSQEREDEFQQVCQDVRLSIELDVQLYICYFVFLLMCSFTFY